MKRRMKLAASLGAYCQTNDTIMGMAKRATVKPQIASEERRAFDSVQERDYLRILHAGAPDLMSDLAGQNAPATQQLPLILRNILVEYIQLPAGTSSSWWFIRISHGSGADSATASWQRAPRQLSMMASQAMPLATWSRTSATKMRVPSKSRLAVAYVWINYNETPNCFGPVSIPHGPDGTVDFIQRSPPILYRVAGGRPSYSIISTPQVDHS